MSPPPSNSISIHYWIYSCFVLPEQLLLPRPKRLRLESWGRVASVRRETEGLSSLKLVLSTKVFSRTRRHRKGRALTAPAPYTSPLLARLETTLLPTEALCSFRTYLQKRGRDPDRDPGLAKTRT